MILNTSAYIPYESVSILTLIDPEYPECPFLRGTGFFVYFPPYDHIFFVTARHCIIDNDNNGRSLGELMIPFDDTSGDNQELIPFSHCLETGYIDDEPDEKEDVMVYVVGSVNDERKKQLMKRSLRLQHQDDVDSIIEHIITHSEKIRTVGFPAISQHIDDHLRINKQPRGWHALIEGADCLKNRYKIKGSSWGTVNADGAVKNCNDNAMPKGGFSGSPILALLPSTPSGQVTAIPIGIFVTTSHFISINVVTNTIANYIISLSGEE